MLKMKLAFAAMAGLAISACGGGSDEAREKQIEAEAAKHGIDADVELDENGEVKSVTVNNGMGAVVGKNLSLPDGFPSDVPVPDSWSIMSTSPVPNGFMVSAMTDGSTDDVFAALRKSLTAKGWTEETTDQPNPMMSRINFVKDDRMTNATLIAGGPQLTVQFVTMKKP